MTNIVIPVGSLTTDDRLRLAELFDAAAGMLQPTHRDGNAEGRVAFLHSLGAALRESSAERTPSLNGMTAGEDPSEFYGDGDPGTSSPPA